MCFQFWCRYCQSAVQRGYTRHDRWESKFLKGSHQSVLSNSKWPFILTLLTLNDAPSCPGDLSIRSETIRNKLWLWNWGIMWLGRAPWHQGVCVSGIPKTQNANLPLPPPPAACRGWRICSYDLPAWEKARHFDSRGVFSLGKDCKLAVQEM